VPSPICGNRYVGEIDGRQEAPPSCTATCTTFTQPLTVFPQFRSQQKTQNPYVELLGSASASRLTVASRAATLWHESSYSRTSAFIRTAANCSRALRASSDWASFEMGDSSEGSRVMSKSRPSP